MSENRRELSACRCWWWSDISPLAPVLHIQAAGLWVSIVRYLLKSAPISGVPCRMCCCCLLPGLFCSVVWLDQVLSPILLLPGAASRVQTVTTRPFLAWVLLSCLRHSVISFCHCTLLVRFPNQSMSSLHLQTYYRLFPLRISVSSSGLLPWAHSGPPLLILPLQVGRGPHNTENSEEHKEELIKALLLLSFLWLPSLSSGKTIRLFPTNSFSFPQLPAGRTSFLFSLTLWRWLLQCLFSLFLEALNLTI